MTINIFTNKKGTTLLEIVVAVAIFSVLTVMAVNIFQAVISSQQSTVASQNKQESLKYILEVMSKDMRSALRSDADCSIPAGTPATNKVYNTDSITNTESDILYFTDKDGVCTYYLISNGTFVVGKGVDYATALFSDTTPQEVLTTDFNFVITDNLITDMVNTVQPMITLSIGIEDRAGKAIEEQKMIVQTTISSRFYEL